MKAEYNYKFSNLSPCLKCEIRQGFAISFDFHWFDGEDCPYSCDRWDKYIESIKNNCEAEDES